LKTFSVRKAHVTQAHLSKKVIREDKLPPKINTVGGVDVSYLGDLGIGAVTVLDYESLEVLEAKVATCNIRIPYLPTLLSFRELPPTLAAIKQLKTQPDVFLADAQGIAHPFRCGFASHLGIALGKPTIGVAKSRLLGEEAKISGRTFLVETDEVIGEVVETEQDAKPVYVSIGHMVSLESAVKIVKDISIRRIPEPTLQAHRLATEHRILLADKAK
jgi:deoxyribonuclease V